MIREIFAVSKYDVQKDKEMVLKDKIARIKNTIDFKIKKLQTATDQKIEALKNSKDTKLDKLNRRLTRIRMSKYNEAKYIYKDSKIDELIEVENSEQELMAFKDKEIKKEIKREKLKELANKNKNRTKTKKEGK